MKKNLISLFNFLDTVGVSIFMTISFSVKSIKDVEYVVWIFEYSELILLFYAWNRHLTGMRNKTKSFKGPSIASTISLISHTFI